MQWVNQINYKSKKLSSMNVSCWWHPSIIMRIDEKRPYLFKKITVERDISASTRWWMIWLLILQKAQIFWTDVNNNAVLWLTLKKRNVYERGYGVENSKASYKQTNNAWDIMAATGGMLDWNHTQRENDNYGQVNQFGVEKSSTHNSQ